MFVERTEELLRELTGSSYLRGLDLRCTRPCGPLYCSSSTWRSDRRTGVIAGYTRGSRHKENRSWAT